MKSKHTEEHIPMDADVRSPESDGDEQNDTAALLDADDKQQTEENKQADDTQQGASTDEGPSPIEELFMKPEQEVLVVLNQVIHEGQDPNKLPRDRRGYSVLHMSAQLNFLSVAEKLLDYGHDPLAYDLKGDIALKVAVRQHSDAMVALIISKTKPEVVRRLFGDTTVVSEDENTPVNGTESKRQPLTRKNPWTTLKAALRMKAVFNSSDKYGPSSDDIHVENTNDGDENNAYAQKVTEEEMQTFFYKESDVKKMFDLNKDLIGGGLEEAVQAVLDSLAEEKVNGRCTVYVKLLEEDNKGLEPGDEGFKTKHHTVFHNIAINLTMDASNHPVMKLLVDYKWQAWCRQKFVLNSCLYLLSLLCLTFSIVVGTSARTVTVYDTTLQHFRAVLEIVTYLFALHTFFTEARQFYRHVLDYWKQPFNWLEMGSSLLVLIALPLRYTQVQAHWFVLAVAYLLWVMRIFKYATVFSQTGAYAESLKRILTGDFLQFSLLFIVINMAFGGTFLLVLRGEGSLQTYDDTDSYWGILFVGLRIMVEAGSVVEYVGSGSFRTTGTIVYLVFMFVTIVVLLNMLIAQLSNTYQKVQNESYKAVRANRAWNITRAERNEWQFCRRQLQRVKYYKPYFTGVDMKRLRKKNVTEMNAISNGITAIKNKQIKDALETLTVKNRVGSYGKSILNKLEHAHGDILTVHERNGLYSTERVADLERKVNEMDKKLDSVRQQLIEMKTLLEANLQGKI